MLIQVVATAFHFVWCYLLVDFYELGATGAGIATTFTHFLTLIALYIYTTLTLKPELRLIAWFHPFKDSSKRDCFDKKGLIDFFK
jgi:Na+-driven multidrug efflux pump